MATKDNSKVESAPLFVMLAKNEAIFEFLTCFSNIKLLHFVPFLAVLQD